jgi:energy-coupling factor transporter ATP-binding protein EcfA2
MKVNFLTLTLQNFKNHQDLTVNFGEMTEITGDNGKGKSSTFEAVTWLLYSNDTMGCKMDPTPITYAADETLVQLLINVDGRQVLLGRGQKKGKAEYYINDVPQKATAFNELVEQLFDKDLFLTLFNPDYFFTLKWEKQRSMLLQYVTSPANKEVLKHIPELQADKLGSLLKKHSLDDIEKIHKDNKNKKDKEYIAAQSKTKTLKGLLEEKTPSVPIDTVKVELSQLKKQRDEIEKVTDSAGDVNGRINVLNNNIQAFAKERDQFKDEHKKLAKSEIEGYCEACEQPLKEESLQVAQTNKDKRLEYLRDMFNKVVAKRKQLEEELVSLEYIDVSEQLDKVRELQAKITPLENELYIHKEYERLQEQVNEAIKNENSTLEILNDSIFVLDCVKAFRAKEAELQAEKVQALFTTLSIRLFKQNKGDGEFKPDFEVQMDGKDYSKLSLSEGIRAGLELREVLSQQSGVIVPCFIDNCESITSFKKPTGQLITSRVVAGKELTVEVKDE